MQPKLKLIVDNDAPRLPEAFDPIQFRNQVVIAAGLTILGLTLVGVGLLWWFNSEAFTRAAIDRLSK